MFAAFPCTGLHTNPHQHQMLIRCQHTWLQQVLAAGAAREVARGVAALQYVCPQLPAHPAAAAKLALCRIKLALGAVAQEQEPALLPLDVLLPLLHALDGRTVAPGRLCCPATTCCW